MHDRQSVGDGCLRRAHDVADQTLALHRASQAWAAIQGRDFVVPDDVKYLAGAVLAHRLMVSLEARLRGRDAAAIIRSILDSVPVPVEPSRR